MSIVPSNEPEYVDDRYLELNTPITRPTWQLWRRTSKGPRWYKIGRRCVYKLAEVRAWVEQHSVGGAS